MSQNLTDWLTDWPLSRVAVYGIPEDLAILFGEEALTPYHQPLIRFQLPRSGKVSYTQRSGSTTSYWRWSWGLLAETNSWSFPARSSKQDTKADKLSRLRRGRNISSWTTSTSEHRAEMNTKNLARSDSSWLRSMNWLWWQVPESDWGDGEAGTVHQNCGWCWPQA